MSAFGGKADVIQGVAECPLIAISGHCMSGCNGGGPAELARGCVPRSWQYVGTPSGQAPPIAAGFFYCGINGIRPPLDSSQAKSDHHKKNNLTKKIQLLDG